jgi:hypothetical protein
MSVEYFYELKSSFLGYIHRYREDMQPGMYNMYSQTCLMWPSKGTAKNGHIRQVVA